MTLRAKTLSVMGLAFAGLVVVLAISFRAAVLDDFRRMAVFDARSDAARVHLTYRAELRDLDSRTLDWAWRDSTRHWVLAADREPLQSQLPPPRLARLRVDVVALFGPDGALLGSVNAPAERPPALPAEVRAYGQAAARREVGAADGANAGYLLTAAEPVLIVTRPVRGSDGRPPDGGLLLMGRFLSQVKLQEWNELNQLQLAPLRADGPRTAEIEAALARTSDEDQIWTPQAGVEGQAGYLMLPDLMGRHALVLRSVHPRSIYHEGRQVTLYLTYIVLITVLSFALVALLFVERFVLARVARLNAGVKAIGVTGDPSARLRPDGADELGQLAEAINVMLQGLDQALRERLEADRRYRSVVTQTTEGIAVFDLDTKALIEANPALLTMLECEPADVPNLTLYDICAEPASGIDAYVERLQAGADAVAEARLRARGGHRIVAEIHANQITLAGREVACAVIRDITARRQAQEERRRFEAQMQHTQKLESLGVLAGGIAHDFNNLLTGVLGNAGLALMNLPPSAPGRQQVERIEAAAHRAAELINQMLAYAGKGAFVIEALDLSRLVTEMAELLRVSVSKLAELRLECAPELAPVRGDATQLRQVVMNLITNAADALGNESGVITLTTSTRCFDQPLPAGDALMGELPAGDYVALRVSDTGCGMDEVTLQRIFDPFFTTKFTGRGLVRAHRGGLRVHSMPGLGTTVEVLLPAVAASQQAAALEPAPEPEDRPLAGRVVLAVDDELTVLEVAAAVLEQAGATVRLAHDGLEGLAIYRADSAVIDLVLLDLTMPGLSGLEVLSAIKAFQPSAKVVLCSGYPQPLMADGTAIAGLSGFLQKPYRPSELVHVLAQALET
jgi:PAS domain S-box-containing protein